MAQQNCGHKMMFRKDIEFQVKRETEILETLDKMPFHHRDGSYTLTVFFHRGKLEAYKNVLG
jgi:hypothetical protein